MLEEHENGEKRVKLGDVAAAFGKGIFAGVAGTAVMTSSSTIEMKLRGRPASSAPAQAATKVLGVQPIDEESEARFSSLVHWGYGSAWGGARGLLGVAGLSGPAALTEWGVQEVAIDALHHLVYAGATGIAYSLLDR
jgi:hypothetical protein